mgnify:CR=1 FL=1
MSCYFKKIIFLLGLTGAALPVAQAGKPDYPETPVREVVHEYGAVRLADPFAWLEDKEDPETEAWFRAQDRVARDFIAGLPGREALFRRIREIDEAKTVNIYSFNRRRDRYFYLKQEVGEEVGSLFYRDGVEGEGKLILDPARLAESEMIHSIEYYVPSWDGTKVLVGISAGGSEIPDLHLLGVDGGEVATIIQVAMMGDLPWTALRDGVFSHPTTGESLNNLFSALETD